MKRVIVIVLAFSIAFALCACGEKKATPFDEIRDLSTITEVEKTLGEPSQKKQELSVFGSPLYFYIYDNRSAFGYADGKLRVNYEGNSGKYTGKLNYAEWVLSGDNYSYDDLEKAVSAITKKLTDYYGEYSREDSDYQWYDTMGNRYLLSTNKQGIRLLFNWSK